jgi:methyl-accepting chemotaxis protein
MNTKLKYTIVGVIFGCMFPIGAIILEGFIKQTVDVIGLHQNNPLLYMIDTAPIFLGAFAYIGGRAQHKALVTQKTILEQTEKLKSEHEEQVKLHEQLSSNQEMASDVVRNLKENSNVLYDVFRNVDANIDCVMTDTKDMQEYGATLFNDSKDINFKAQTIHENSKVIETMTVDIAKSIEKVSGDLSMIVSNIQLETVKLNELNDEISVIDSLKLKIDSISDEIDLLALNAAIESARAGEHGKGFAVVANEIQKLSQDSHNATNAITESISHLTDRTRLIQDSFNKIQANVSLLSDHINDVTKNVANINEFSCTEIKASENILNSTVVQEDNISMLSKRIEDINRQIGAIEKGVKSSNEALTYNNESIEMLSSIGLK